MLTILYHAKGLSNFLSVLSQSMVCTKQLIFNTNASILGVIMDVLAGVVSTTEVSYSTALS